MTPARNRLTEQDVASLSRMTTEWRMTPPCFSPNGLCRDQEHRGLVELSQRGGRWFIRRTVHAEALLATGAPVQ